MQSYKLNLSPTKQSDVIYTEARGIWYESGDSAINPRIVVTPIGGGDVELKPGQNLKLNEKVTQWMVKSLDPAATIDGKLLLGSGEFQDNSSLVTLDNTFTNEVTVMNPITIDGVATVQENLIAINYSHASGASLGGLNVIQLIAPGANTKGVIIQSAKLFGSNPASAYSLLAKSSAPANEFDGNVILYVPAGTTAAQFLELTGKLKIDAGKGLYLYATNYSATAVRLINASIL